MSDREKLLGIAVGALLTLFAFFGIYKMVDSGLKAKRNEINNLAVKHKQAKGRNNLMKRDRQMVEEYRKRSLPGDLNVAHREFVHWLQQNVKDVGLTRESVRFHGMPTTKKEHKELSYNVSGVGNIKQITELLHRFYSVENLQRISSLNLQKQKEANQLKLDMVVSAISLPSNDPSTKIPIGTVSKDRLPKSLEDYLATITARNMFSPGNLPPKIERGRIDDVELGSRLRHSLKAEDPDGDDIEFELSEDAPEWLEISKSGALRGRPPEELKEYEFTVFVQDTGFPPKKDERKFKFAVVEKPEPPRRERREESEFDDATTTFLTMITSKGGNPEVCLSVRSLDEKHYLVPGDEFEIGTWSAKLTEVEPRRNRIRLTSEEGEFTLSLGQVLAEAKQIKKEVTKETSL